MSSDDDNVPPGSAGGLANGKVKELVRAFLLENFLMNGRPEDIADGTSFIEARILDSTGFIELIAFLEETFGLAVLEPEIVPENLDSLRSIEAFVARKQGH